MRRKVRWSRGRALRLAVAGVVIVIGGSCGDSCRRKSKHAPPPPATACPTITATPVGPTVSVWDDGSVAMAIPIEVEDGAAQGLVVDQIGIAGGTTAQPTGPLAIGELLPGQPRPVQAVFKVAADGTPRAVTVAGTFTANGTSCTFSITARAAPAPTPAGPLALKPVTAPVVTLATATWPTPPPPVPAETNTEDVFGPVGPVRNFMTTPPVASRIAKLPAFTDPYQPPEQGGPSAAIFTRNNGAGAWGGIPPDPSVAATLNSGVVMLSANMAVSWSKDWGATFTQVNLTGIVDPADPKRTTFFPAKDGGLCCDQVLTYSPKYDLFIWVHQTWPTTRPSPGVAAQGPNRLYLAWAKPSAVAADFLHAWRWVELDTTLFALPAKDWMDYPDVTVSDNNVYFSVDHARGNSPISRIFARWSLADMASGAGSIGGAYIDIADGGITKAHMARQSPDTMYFAARYDTSTLHAYTLADSATSASWVPVPYSSITYNYASNAPDKLDWNTAPNRVLGATLTMPAKLCFDDPACNPAPRRVVWYAFAAGSSTDGTRPQPYVRLVAIDMGAGKRETEVDIWNSGFAFSTPSIASSPCLAERCDIAISLAVGGGGGYAENAVGFLYDWLVYVTTASDATHTYDCTPAKAATKSYCTRYGDYFNVMPSQGPPTAHGNGQGFSTVGYSVRATTAGQPCSTGGCAPTLQYTQFGRDGALNPSGPPR